MRRPCPSGTFVVPGRASDVSSPVGGNPEALTTAGDPARLAPALTPLDDPTLARRALHQSFFKAVAWTGSVKWIGQLITWPVTILIAKLLSPGDYGFITLVSTLTRFMALMTEGGVGLAIVSNPTLGDREMRQLNGFALLLGLGAIACCLLLARPVAVLTHDPAAARVLLVLSATLLLDAATIVPTGQLRRAFRYRELALLEAMRSLATLGSTLLLASRGMGYWSLVFGYALGSLVQSVGTVVVARVAVARPHWSVIGPTLRVSVHLLLGNIGEFVSSNTDRLVGGLVLGSAALGGYTFAWVLAFTPSEKITSMVARVVPSLFGRMRDKPSELIRYSLRIAETVSVITLPAFVGLALIADQVVGVLLGAKWVGAVGPLRAFCLYAGVLDCMLVVPHALTASSHVRPLSQNALIAMLVYPPLFFVLGTTFGTTGLALTWAVVGTVLNLRLLLVMSRRLGMPLHAYGRSLFPGVSSCLVMAVAVLGTRLLIVPRLNPVGGLLAVVGVGVVSYVAALLALHGARVRATVGFLMEQRRMPVPGAP
jgi:O-antigen/teichoic acid export membrane protein